MRIKKTIRKLALSWDKLSLQTRIVIGSFLVMLAGYGLIFGFSKPVAFAYDGQSCTRQLTIAPTFAKQTTESGFLAQFKDVVTVVGFPVASLKTCFVALQPPRTGETLVKVSPFGGIVAMKVFAVRVGEPPAAQVGDFVDKTVPVTRPLQIALTGVDEVFSYKFKVDEKQADCRHEDSTLHCDIEKLELAQGQVYTASLIRYFHDTQLEVVGEGSIQTLKALVLVSATVADGQTIYDKPSSFTFEYDKPLEDVTAELKLKSGEVIEAAVALEGVKAIVTALAELKRNAEFTLTITKAEAMDGSALSAPQVVNFNTSGGPKVAGISVNSTGVALSGSIVITFDQDIANTDAVAKLVAVNGLAAQVSGSGKRVVINYSAGACVAFTITVKKGFESAAGVAQDEDWGFAGRTSCYTVRTIGYSKQGRAINAFIFGSGSKTILYTGAIHGNEQSSRLLMNAWINELDANAGAIPAGTRIVIIPSVNPDGVAANTRYNSAGVDLNRNYNTSDWKSDVETVGGDPLVGGGGSSPGSEPETQALMAFTNELRPRLTMSYHSSAAYAIGNTCGDSPALAAKYAELTGYRNMTGVGGAFSYQITGTYDDWMCERLGLTSVLIELATSSNAEFSRNKAALWAMARP